MFHFHIVIHEYDFNILFIAPSHTLNHIGRVCKENIKEKDLWIANLLCLLTFHMTLLIIIVILVESLTMKRIAWIVFYFFQNQNTFH